MTVETVKHTKGPWVIYPDPNDTYRDSIPIVSGEAVVAAVWPMGESDSSPYESEESQANARLIAAAPDLLVVLERMTDWLESFRPAVDGSGASDIEQQWIANARAAIARATA